MALEFTLNKDSKKLENEKNTKNVTFADMDAFSNIEKYVMDCKDANLTSNSKLFLKEILSLSSMEVSFAHMEPNVKGPFFHQHKQNEELYIVLSGNGVMNVDGDDFTLKEGSLVKVSPQGVRNIASGSLGLSYICIQAKQGSLEQYTMTDATII